MNARHSKDSTGLHPLSVPLAILGEDKPRFGLRWVTRDSELSPTALLNTEQSTHGFNRLELEDQLGFEVEFQGELTGRPCASFKPEVLNRRKSASFMVAMSAPSASATAAIMQSINDPRRLPDSLNKWAAIAA